MASDWPTVVGSLGGVTLGAGITWFRDNLREKQKAKKDATYLAILVMAHLDRLIDDCLNVAYDSGIVDDRGFTEPEYKIPEFDPLSLDVEWKVLPAELMYSILNLPYRLQQIRQRLSDPGFDDPPDYGEFFWARRTNFATLGLEVVRVTKLLRRHAQLPRSSIDDDRSDREVSLQAQLNAVDRAKADYRARNASVRADLDV